MVIRISNVTKHYRVGDEEIRALDGVSLDVGHNEYVAIMGTSGSGKSTLMNILGCLDRPTSGTYELRFAATDGAPPDRAQIERALEKELARLDDDRDFLRRANIGNEGMRPEDQERVRRIAGYRWTGPDGIERNLLDDRQALAAVLPAVVTGDAEIDGVLVAAHRAVTRALAMRLPE